ALVGLLLALPSARMHPPRIAPALRLADSIAPTGSGNPGLAHQASWEKPDGMGPSAMILGAATMKKTKSGAKETKGAECPSRLIDARIKKLGDWRGKVVPRAPSSLKQRL